MYGVGQLAEVVSGLSDPGTMNSRSLPSLSFRLSISNTLFFIQVLMMVRVRAMSFGSLFGDPDAGAMVHGFDRLIAHAAKTRALSAGSIVGGGTVASSERARGTSCITERRVLEQLDTGSAVTPYLHYGDKVRSRNTGRSRSVDLRRNRANRRAAAG